MTQPTTEIGYATRSPYAWASFAGSVEDVPDLIGDVRIRTHNWMRNDAMTAGLYTALPLPIRRYKWALDSNGARDEVVVVAVNVAKATSLPIIGQDSPRGRSRGRFSFGDHLRQSLLKLVYGSTAATLASSTIASSESVHATLQAEIDALTKTKYWLASEVVQLPSIAVGKTEPVTATWSTPAPSTDYSCTASLSDPGSLLGSLSVTVDLTSRTTTRIKVKVKKAGLVALSLNAVQLLVIGGRGYRPT